MTTAKLKANYEKHLEANWTREGERIPQTVTFTGYTKLAHSVAQWNLMIEERAKQSKDSAIWIWAQESITY